VCLSLLLSQAKVLLHERCDESGQHIDHPHRSCSRVSLALQVLVLAERGGGRAVHEWQGQVDLAEEALGEDGSVPMVQHEVRQQAKVVKPRGGRQLVWKTKDCIRGLLQ
jgi:hypothetical protein